jgi:hypothetical protein
MKELLKRKQEAFAKYLHHMDGLRKNEIGARKWRLEGIRINEEIRAMERELSNPIKVVY